jgi:prepilin-type N-terminal cleavage/methylation domain-containing protein/prepilin-type processing-associated H-X9-DG protein
MNGRRGTRGFTLVELLVVIAIIGILVALLLPAVQAAREAARRMSCSNNLKQIALAAQNYHDTHKTFPTEGIWYYGNLGNFQQGAQRNFSWLALTLPYLEQTALHGNINFSVPALAGPNAAAMAADVPNMLCPSDEAWENKPGAPLAPAGLSVTSYAGNSGWHDITRDQDDPWNGFMPTTRTVNFSMIKDGTSNTIAFGEVSTSGYVLDLTVNPQGKYFRGGLGTPLRGQNRIVRAALVATQADGMALPDADGMVRNTGWNMRAWTGPFVHKPTYASRFGMNTHGPGAASKHPGGAQFALADGSVRFISENIETGAEDPNNMGWGLPPDAPGNGNLWAAIHTINGDKNYEVLNEIP